MTNFTLEKRRFGTDGDGENCCMGCQAKNNTEECIDDYLESRKIEYSSSSSDVITKEKKTFSKKRTILSVTILKFVTTSEGTNFG